MAADITPEPPLPANKEAKKPFFTLDTRYQNGYCISHNDPPPVNLPLRPPKDSTEDGALLRPASLHPPASLSHSSLSSLLRDDATLPRFLLPEAAPPTTSTPPILLPSPPPPPPRWRRRRRRRPPPPPPPARRRRGKRRGHHQVTARASTDRMRQPVARTSCRLLHFVDFGGGVGGGLEREVLDIRRGELSSTRPTMKYGVRELVSDRATKGGRG